MKVENCQKVISFDSEYELLKNLLKKNQPNQISEKIFEKNSKKNLKKQKFQKDRSLYVAACNLKTNEGRSLKF